MIQTNKHENVDVKDRKGWEGLFYDGLKSKPV
jgi:hypothetical protein